MVDAIFRLLFNLTAELFNLRLQVKLDLFFLAFKILFFGRRIVVGRG